MNPCYNTYTEQAISNQLALWEDQKFRCKKETLRTITKAFSPDITWGIGCSLNLFLRGIVDNFGDIDIITTTTSVEKVKETLLNLGGTILESGGNGYCESDFYFHFKLGEVDIDVISGFRVKTYLTQYYYTYTSASELDTCVIAEDINVNLIPLEALYVLYWMMIGWQPRRKFKKNLIRKYLENAKTLKHREIWDDALSTQNLPPVICRDIKALLSGK